jgi:hypothetical protein
VDQEQRQLIKTYKKIVPGKGNTTRFYRSCIIEKWHTLIHQKDRLHVHAQHPFLTWFHWGTRPLALVVSHTNPSCSKYKQNERERIQIENKEGRCLARRWMTFSRRRTAPASGTPPGAMQVDDLLEAAHCTSVGDSTVAPPLSSVSHSYNTSSRWPPRPSALAAHPQRRRPPPGRDPAAPPPACVHPSPPHP